MIPGAAMGQYCSELNDFLTLGKYIEAEALARECMKQDPTSVFVWIGLSKALAFQDKHDEALSWIQVARSAYPNDMDILTQEIRILSWKGAVDEAWEKTKELPPENLKDPETALLVANVNFWSEHYDDAVNMYTAFLDQEPENPTALRNRGNCYRILGDDEKAKADFEKLCALSKTDKNASCRPLQELAEERARFTLMIQPHYWLETKEYVGQNLSYDFEGYGGKVLFDARIKDTWHLGGSFDYRTRQYNPADGLVDDEYIEIFSSYLWPVGFKLSGAAGFTIAPDFLPTFTAQIEPGWVFDFGLEVYLKYWRLQFENDGVNVLSPAAIYYIGPAMFYLRYYLGIDDDPNIDPSNSLIGKAMLTFAPISFWAGGGIGDRADYLELDNTSNDGYWMLMAGIGWQIHWRHNLAFDYIYREEDSENDRIQVHFIRHQFLLSYTVKF